MCVVRVLSYFYVERERDKRERERERDVRTFSKKKSAKKEEQEDKAIIVIYMYSELSFCCLKVVCARIYFLPFKAALVLRGYSHTLNHR